MSTLRLAALSVFVAAGLAGRADADVLKVPKYYSSIQSAVNDADPGDVVEIAGGIYFEHVTVLNKHDIVLRAKKGDVVKISADGSGVPLNLSLCESVRVERLRVMNSSDATGIYVSLSTGVTIKACRATDTVNGIYVTQSTGCEVQKCIVTKTTDVGIRIGLNSARCSLFDNEVRDFESVGIRAVGSRHAIERNTVVGQGSEAGSSYTGISIGDSFAAAGCSRTAVVGNEVRDVRVTGIRLTYPGSPDCAVIDNEVKNVGGTGIWLDTGSNGCVLERNDVNGTGQHGFQIDSVDCVVTENVVKKAKSNGFSLPVFSEDHVFLRNKVSKVDGYGFFVGGTGISFVRNDVSACGQGDLYPGSGDNTYICNSFSPP